MNILVFGAGAVGSYYGGRLAQAGHQVMLVGRRTHVEAIRAEGLLIDSTIAGKTRVHPQAAESLDAVEPPNLVLLSVKSYDTEAAARSLNSRIGSKTLVLTLQNGVDNHEIAGKILGAGQVRPAVIYVGARISKPGVVMHTSRGEIILPKEVRDWCPVFETAGIPARFTDNIVGMLWEKLLLNASCNVLSMISGAPFGELAANPHSRELICEAVGEILRIAERYGVRIPSENAVDRVLKAAESLGTGISSMRQDYQAGKRIEVDALNGVVVRLGREAGIPTPVNTTLYAMARLLGENSSRR